MAVDVIGAAQGWALKKAFDAIATGFSEAIRNTYQSIGLERAEKFGSVSELWHLGIDQNRLSACAKVQVRGEICGFIPLSPAHPKSRLGRQIKTWVENWGSRDNFSTKSLLAWGDPVLFPPKAGKDYSLYGFYDRLGLVGLASIPLLVDLNSTALKKSLGELFSSPRTPRFATVTGRLTRLPINIVSDYGLLPITNGQKEVQHPNFALEALHINVQAKSPVLFGIEWIAKRNTAFPIYCNLADEAERSAAVAHLASAATAKNVEAVFDPTLFKVLKEIPVANQWFVQRMKEI
jgi:hypothetical protein